MRRLAFYLCIILIISVPHGVRTGDNYFVLYSRMKDVSKEITKLIPERSITSMEALDRVKELYAANFEKVYTNDTCEEYYYKLPFADYYLAYETAEEYEKDYVIHLYEFVLDEPETGIGHTVTYGWYRMDKESGVITDQTQN